MLKKISLIKPIGASREKGAIIILALIMLAIGSLILIPLLSFMASGYKTTDQVYDQKAHQLYAADAGVRYAIKQIQSGNIPSSDVWTDVTGPLGIFQARYNITLLPPSNPYGSEAYRIISDGGVDPANNNQKTTITSDIIIIDLFNTYAGNAITSTASVTGGGDPIIACGDVQAPSTTSAQIVYYTYLTAPVVKNSYDPIQVLNNNDFTHFPDSGKVTIISSTKNSQDRLETIQYSSRTVDTLLIDPQKANADHDVGDAVYLVSTTINPDLITDGLEGWPIMTNDINPVQTFYYNQVRTLTENDITYDSADHEIILASSGPNGPAYFNDGNPNQEYKMTGEGELTGVIFVDGNLVIEGDVNLGRELDYALNGSISPGDSTITVYEPTNDFSNFPIAGRVIVGEGTEAEKLEYSSINRTVGVLTLKYPLTELTRSHSSGEKITLWLGQTIFATGSIEVTGDYGGPGCLVALGDIYFTPNINNNQKYIYIMSVDGDVHFQPANNVVYYGSIAGENIVDFQSNNIIVWQDYIALGYNLNLPGSDGYAKVPGNMQTWIIN